MFHLSLRNQNQKVIPTTRRMTIIGNMRMQPDEKKVDEEYTFPQNKSSDAVEKEADCWKCFNLATLEAMSNPQHSVPATFAEMGVEKLDSSLHSKKA